MDVSKSHKLSLIDDRSRHSELLNRLNKLRISKAFCDVTIFVENKEFMAHKVILASSSDYFLSKFTEDAKCDRLSVNLNKEIFNLLLDYFYTSNLIVSKEKVPQLFAAAKYLKVRRVVKVCSQFLTNFLTLDNIIDVRESVALHDSEDLCKAADNFIKENMDKIISQSNIVKLNMDIIVETVPKKENDFRLAELIIDWLECSIVEDNMKLSDFANENLVFFLTPSNSLIRCSEIASHNKFSSSFINDYFNGFLSSQKNINKRVKCRARSKERPSKNSSATNKSKYQTSDHMDRDEKDVIMVQSDEHSPEDWKLNKEDDSKKSDESQAKLSQCSSRNSRFSSFDGTNDIENFVDEEAYPDNDNISNSIKCKTSAKPEQESCLISVNSTEIFENDLSRLKIRILAKVNGKFMCVSLHIKSILEIINQGIQDCESSLDIFALHGQKKQTRSTATYGSESTSGMSSSSVSAASSLLHVDTISNFTDEALLKSDGLLNETKSDDQANVLHHLFKKVQNRVSTLERFDCLSASRCAAGLVNVNDQLMIIGGFNRGECLNSVEIYQPMTNKWSHSISMKLCRARLVALADQSEKTNSYIYAIGGSDGHKELSTVERFDVNNQKWSRIASLNQARSYHGGSSIPLESNLGGNLVVAGGCFGPDILRSCELYDSYNNKWLDQKSMTISRSQAAVACIENQLFVVGGTDSWKCLSSCEIMDLREGKWRVMPEPSYPRRGAALLPYNGKLYLFGGSDGNSSLKTLEIFDLVANQWCLSMEQMKQSRANLCGGILLNKLVAIGGFTGKHFLDTMECLDFDESGENSSEWSLFVPNDWSNPVGKEFSKFASDECIESEITITSGTNNEFLKKARFIDTSQIQ